MKYRIYISGQVALSADLTLDRVKPVLQATLQKMPEMSERGKVLVTLDNADHPNIVHILATRRAASDLGRVSI